MDEAIIKVISLLKEEDGRCCADKLCLSARELRKAGRRLDSIPWLLAAASLYEKEEDKGEAVKGLWNCVSGMCTASIEIDENDDNTKKAFKDHVIPLMHAIKDKMGRLEMEPFDEKCEYLVEVHHWIAKSAVAAGALEAAESIIKDSSVVVENVSSVSLKLRLDSQIHKQLANVYHKMAESYRRSDLKLAEAYDNKAKTCLERANEVHEEARWQQ